MWKEIKVLSNIGAKRTLCVPLNFEQSPKIFKILLIHVNALKFFIFALWWGQPLTKNKILYIGYVFIILWIPLPSINIHVAVIYDLSLYEQTWKFVAFDWFTSIYQGRIQDFLLGGKKFGRGSRGMVWRVISIIEAFLAATLKHF